MTTEPDSGWHGADAGGASPVLFCDAMLGGLARWLRAAGYDARFEHGIEDGALVGRAQAASGVILSSDGPLFERKIVRSGIVPSLYVPRGLDLTSQLAFVLRELALPLAEPRCMACGGRLGQLAKVTVEPEVPPRTYAFYEEFWRCERCRRLFWHGTHWSKISHRLGMACADVHGVRGTVSGKAADVAVRLRHGA